jgi:hypothetical protein
MSIGHRIPSRTQFFPPIARKTRPNLGCPASRAGPQTDETTRRNPPASQRSLLNFTSYPSIPRSNFLQHAGTGGTITGETSREAGRVSRAGGLRRMSRRGRVPSRSRPAPGGGHFARGGELRACLRTAARAEVRSRRPSPRGRGRSIAPTEPLGRFRFWTLVVARERC